MINQHPLTLKQIADLTSTRPLTEDFCNDMRTAYDLGSANEWLSRFNSADEWISDSQRRIDDMKKAMRPNTGGIMTELLHPLTTAKCEEITAKTEGEGQGVSHESMRAAYDYAVDFCANWLYRRYHNNHDMKALALYMKVDALAEPKSLKQQMLYVLENDDDNDRLLELINSMEDS